MKYVIAFSTKKRVVLNGYCTSEDGNTWFNRHWSSSTKDFDRITALDYYKQWFDNRNVIFLEFELNDELNISNINEFIKTNFTELWL